MKGFGFRKSVRLGGARLNLSKSGLGASIGAGGMRVGTGPRGSRLSMSKGGLTFRRGIFRKGRREAVSREDFETEQEYLASQATARGVLSYLFVSVVKAVLIVLLLGAIAVGAIIYFGTR